MVNPANGERTTPTRCGQWPPRDTGFKVMQSGLDSFFNVCVRTDTQLSGGDHAQQANA